MYEILPRPTSNQLCNNLKEGTGTVRDLTRNTVFIRQGIQFINKQLVSGRIVELHKKMRVQQQGKQMCGRSFYAMHDRNGVINLQRGSTEEMPENVPFCIQKAATHSHFIRSTPF